MKDRFANWTLLEIRDGVPTKYNWVVHHVANLRLDYRTDIGAFTYINAKHGVVIEDKVQIGSPCSIYSVSTIDSQHRAVTLRHDCRIGTHSAVMPGITVGEGAIVGARSINHDIPADSLAYGVPAKVIRKLTQEERERR